MNNPTSGPSLKEHVFELFSNEKKEKEQSDEREKSVNLVSSGDEPSVIRLPDDMPGDDGEKDVPEDLIPSSTDVAVMDALKIGIEKEIDKTVDIELRNSDPISESSNQGGFAYEGFVLRAIKRAGIQGVITKTAGADASIPDADIKIDGQLFNVEVKLDRTAQMGGSSVRFGKQGITLTKEMEAADLLIEAVSSRSKDINRLLAFISKQKPAAYNKVSSFPMSCTKQAWEKAQKNGLLLQERLNYNASFIAKHYARKGIFYIQIGGAGLFYMAGNPANLPIPQLTGDIGIEIRSARSAAKKLKNGLSVCGAGIRVIARLKSKGSSPYTLDDPKSIMLMLAAMKALKAPSSKPKTDKPLPQGTSLPKRSLKGALKEEEENKD